ncbi:uncharacterized protein LOC128252415 [Drosophila gunungcola]|uniref:uncharacterized protein LOC128252415 n=1 Tax=Drosophila gunungcola TaxID=103775 RepID=UPI0022E08C25|nr:uncharacterized protein LOC128252415 [Drosophila gunungcola]
MTAASLPRVPEGLRDLMKVYTKEVLREKPADLYGFSANFFNVIVGEKSHQMVRKYEPVQTYETIMKNRVRQQVPLSLVFNIIPEKLTDLIKQFIKAVLKEKPENIYIFAQEYFQRMSKEKSGRIEYSKYSTYEKSLKVKENVAPVSKVTCECGRTLSAKTQDGENTASAYTDTKLAEADQSTFSSSISYLQSVVIIQRNFRRYLKQRNIAREKDKCNSVEYVAAILLIQRQVRGFLAQKRVEKLKNSRDAPKPKAKFNTADYMKAVVVIQRHYRIYLTKKREHNRLKNGPVSLATAAIVIQRAFRRMVALHRAKRSASSAADQGEELNDNASETGSYTSVSTALLSTESTELGIANYEERVHQKIIHEDEEVENNNVDVGLEKEYFAEPIKGAEKSIQQRKSEILSGALIENMICKPNLENIMDFNKESKDLEGDAEMIPSELESIKDFTNESIDLKLVDEISTEPGDEAEKNIASQVLGPEIKTNKASLNLESAAQTGFNTERGEEKLKSANSETQAGIKDKPSIKDMDTIILKENEGTDLVEREDHGFSDSNLAKEIEKKENDSVGHALKTMDDSFDKLEDKHNDEKDKANEIFKIPQNIRSESELQEVIVKTEVSVSPAVSIEIEHVKDILEDSISAQHDANVDLAMDLSDIDLLADESCVKPTIEIDSFKSVLVNHNRDVRGQESSSEMNFEASTDPLDKIKNEESVVLKSTLSEKDASIENENKPSPISREKRSIEDKESIQSKSEIHEPSTKGDFVLQNEWEENLKPIIQDEVQISRDKVFDESSEPISAMEEIARTQPNAENEKILESIEIVTNNVEESLEEVLKPMSEESSLDIPAQVDEPINDCKEIMAKSTDHTTDNSQIEDESLKPEITSIGESSDLSRVEAERESKIFDDLKANKEDLEIVIQPESCELDTNVENSLNKSDHSLEKLLPDETEMEIKKLSNQETLPRGSESLEIEKISPAEGAEEKVKPNEIDSFKSAKLNNVIATTDINDSVEEILVQATTLLERDISESLKNDSELSDTQTENKAANEEIKTNNANAPPQSIITSIEDVMIADAKVTTEVANISQAEDKQLDNESLPMEYESMHIEHSEQQQSLKPSAEDSDIADSKQLHNFFKYWFLMNFKFQLKFQLKDREFLDLKTNKWIQETLLMESKSMHIEDSKLQDESKEIDQILTEQSKSLQLEDEESDKKPSTIKPETEEVKDGKLENEASELNIYVPEVAKEEKDKSEPSEISESFKKVLLTSQEIKLPCETIDSHKNSDEDVENLSQSNDGVMSMIDTAIAVFPDEEALANKILESDSIVEPTINNTREVGNEESLDQTKSEPGLEKKEPDEGHIVALEDGSPNPATKSGISDTLHVEQKDDSTDLIKSSPDAAEDTNTEESKPKRESPSAPNPDKKSSLLVTNQLIGTQNLPTNHIEIEKNTKKLTSPSVKDKDIGTLTSGRLVPTPIAELQLKSFKTPNDDGAWYDIYVEPKLTSDQDSGNNPAPVQATKPEADQPASLGVEEPTIVAERVPSYYTPQEIVEAVVPKAKNSVSFFVSLDPDDGKPKYQIPKKFRDPSKEHTEEEVVNDDVAQSEYDFDSNEEEIEVIEVSEGDPEYQQTGGTKLQTILELDNENEQSPESTNQNTALEPAMVDSSEENTNEVESNSGKTEVDNISEESNEKLLTKFTKSETEHFELAYKTDILNITRSVQIIERAYSRFKSKRFLKGEPGNKLDLEKQNKAAKIIQKWVRDSLMKKSLRDSQKSKESLAAKKIQRAYRKYVEKTKERKSENEKLNKIKKENSAAHVIQNAFRQYFQRNKIEPNKFQPSDKSEFEKNQAAGKIQRAYRRYLKLSDKPAMTNELQSQELQEVLDSVVDTSKLKLSDEQETSCRQQSVKLQNIEKPLNTSLSSNQIMKELQIEDPQDVEKVIKTTSNQIELSNCTNQPKMVKELKDELSYDEPEIINEVQSEELKETENLSGAKSSPIHTPKLADNPEIIKELRAVELEAQMPTKENLAQKLEDQQQEKNEPLSDELIEIKHSLEDSTSPIHLSKSLKSQDINNIKNPSEVSLSPTHTQIIADNPEITKDLKVDELKKENPAKEHSSIKLAEQLTETKKLKSLKDSLSSISLSKSSDESAIIAELVAEELQAIENPAEDGSSPKSADNPEITKDLREESFPKLEKPAEAYLTPIQDTPEIKIEIQPNELSSQDKPEIIIELHSDGLQVEETPAETISSSISSSNDELDGEASAALVIQRAFRHYMERKKLENFDESSFDSITSSRITAIETSNYQTAVTPVESLVHEATEEPGEDASRISQKSGWFVGTTRIVPSQGVVEEHRGVETDPDPAVVTRKTELNTSTQVESVETVDRTHGSLESKLTPGISSSNIDESLGSASEKDNAVSSGLAGLTETSEAGLGSVEDPLLLAQSDFGGIVQALDIASTQELVNNFLENEIEYSSRQGAFQPQAVIEEPCVKKSASLVNLLSEGESEPETVSQKADYTDSSVSETTGLDTLSADTIDKATVKLSKPEEVIEKMSQLKDSKSHDRLPSAAPSFDEPVVRPMSSLQEQYSLDIEDGDIIVYNRLQREETRESSAQSDSVVFGEAEAETVQLNEEESGRVHLMRHYTIAGDDPRGLFRSVTIDDALSYVEIGEKDMAINSSNSLCLDDETSENIRKKMMAYSLSETDSDYFDPRKTSTEDFEIDTAMADAMGTSTETESTIVSAATKIQAGARGFLTRRRLRRASAGTKSSTLDTKASFGNDAISESLERFIEEEAAKKIQAAYRMHTRKRKGHSRKMEGISLESNLAARRQKLQRGDALRNDSTPDDENSSSTSGGQAPRSSKIVKSKTVGDSKSKPDMELKWLKMRQNSMPVQIDCEVFRVIPKHMRKRIKSAEANKRK